MTNFTSNTYQMKRKILTFTNKISRHLSKPNIFQNQKRNLLLTSLMVFWLPEAAC